MRRREIPRDARAGRCVLTRRRSVRSGRKPGLLRTCGWAGVHRTPARGRIAGRVGTGPARPRARRLRRGGGLRRLHRSCSRSTCAAWASDWPGIWTATFVDSPPRPFGPSCVHGSPCSSPVRPIVRSRRPRTGCRAASPRPQASEHPAPARPRPGRAGDRPGRDGRFAQLTSRASRGNTRGMPSLRNTDDDLRARVACAPTPAPSGAR